MSDKKMHAIQFDDYGGPEVLNWVEIARPEPGEGQVLMRVHAAGVNPTDWKTRAGYAKSYRTLQLPWTPGVEAAGTVEALGPGVHTFRPGEAIYGALMEGGYAEYLVAQANDLQVIPGGLSFEEAAAIPLGALTAWGAVFDKADVQKGQKVLVQGAAGGVGVYAIQLAQWKGAQVYGTASTVNMDFLRDLGVQAIDYTAGPFEEKVHNIDVVIDTVGGDIPQRSLKVLRKGGTFVTVAARLEEDFGKTEGVTATRSGRAAASRLKDISELVEAGKLKPVIYKVFPITEARQAQELSQTGHGRGRIILKV